jgi:hypothetical protein
MSARQVAQAKMTDANPNELSYFVSQLVKHAPDLPVDSLSQNNPHARHPDRLHFLHSCAFSVEHHAGQQLRRERWFPGTIERHFVFLFDFVAGMSQALREIAVVGQDEKPFGLRVEPANIEKAREFGRQEIENRVARIRIGARGNEARRFVQDDVEVALAVDQLVADFDVIALRRLRAEIGADATVDRNATVGDHLVAMPPRTDTSGGEETI